MEEASNVLVLMAFLFILEVAIGFSQLLLVLYV